MDSAFAQQIWTAFVLSTPRLVGISLFMPFLRTPQVPMMARNAVIAALGIMILPLVWSEINDGQMGAHILFVLAAKEMMIGVILGFILSLTFMIPQAVGDFIDNQRGASIASVFNPAFGDQSSPLGLLLSQAFLVWFIAAGGMVIFMEFMLTSFAILPVTSFLPEHDPALFEHISRALSAFLRLALVVAGPVVLSMLVSEIALGLVSRFAPQLNVFFISMSFKSIIAIVILLFYFGNILSHIWREGLFFDAGYEFLREAVQ